MTRDQRRMHAFVWMLLGPLLLCGLVALIALRPAMSESPSSMSAGSVP